MDLHIGFQISIGGTIDINTIKYLHRQPAVHGTIFQISSVTFFFFTRRVEGYNTREFLDDVDLAESSMNSIFCFYFF